MLSNAHRGDLVWSMLKTYFGRLLGDNNGKDDTATTTTTNNNATTHASTTTYTTNGNGTDANNNETNGKPEMDMTKNIVCDRMPLLCGRIVMCVLVCLHRLLYLQGSMANALLDALHDVIRRIPLDLKPRKKRKENSLATIVGRSTLGKYKAKERASRMEHCS